VKLKMENGTTEDSLESGDEKRANEGSDGGGQQQPAKVRQQPMCYTSADVFLNALRKERPLKGI
jgi:hypothetical protein